MLKLSQDINFKIALTSIRVIQMLVTSHAKQLAPIYKHLYHSLILKLEDNKIVIRHAVLKIIHSLV